jgi:uncharacterized protein YydD (DUF2326 family)
MERNEGILKKKVKNERKLDPVKSEIQTLSHIVLGIEHRFYSKQCSAGALHAIYRSS